MEVFPATPLIRTISFPPVVPTETPAGKGGKVPPQHSTKRCPDVPSQETWAGSELRAEEWGGKAAGLGHPTSQDLPMFCEHL